MSNTTHRALFGAIAVIPAIAARAIAAVANPDGALLKLGVDLQAAEAVRDAALADNTAAEARYQAIRPKEPATLRWQLGDPGDVRPGLTHWDETEIRKAREAYAAMPGWNRATLRRCDEILGALVPFRAADLRANEVSGCVATAVVLVEADETVYALEERILATRALTPTGRALKARIALAKLSDEPEADYGSAWARSALADVIAGG
jgi:hypothetical protein